MFGGHCFECADQATKGFAFRRGVAGRGSSRKGGSRTALTQIATTGIGNHKDSMHMIRHDCPFVQIHMIVLFGQPFP